MDRAFKMSQQLLGKIDDRTYRGPYLFHPQTPFDPIGCPDCDTSFKYTPSTIQNTQPIPQPEPLQFPFKTSGKMSDDGIQDNSADNDSTDDDESGGNTIDNGLPQTGKNVSINDLVKSVSDVGNSSRKEDEIFEKHTPELSGFTILNKSSLEHAVSWDQLGNVLVFLNNDDFQRIVNGDISKVLNQFDSGVAINKNFIMIGWNPNTNCSKLPCIDSATMTTIKTEKYGETVLPNPFINMMMLIFGTQLTELGHKVTLQGVDSSIKYTDTMEDALKLLAGQNYKLFHVKKNS